MSRVRVPSGRPASCNLETWSVSQDNFTRRVVAVSDPEFGVVSEKKGADQRTPSVLPRVPSLIETNGMEMVFPHGVFETNPPCLTTILQGPFVTHCSNDFSADPEGPIPGPAPEDEPTSPPTTVLAPAPTSTSAAAPSALDSAAPLAAPEPALAAPLASHPAAPIAEANAEAGNALSIAAPSAKHSELPIVNASDAFGQSPVPQSSPPPLARAPEQEDLMAPIPTDAPFGADRPPTPPFPDRSSGSSTPCMDENEPVGGYTESYPEAPEGGYLRCLGSGDEEERNGDGEDQDGDSNMPPEVAVPPSSQGQGQSQDEGQDQDQDQDQQDQDQGQDQDQHQIQGQEAMEMEDSDYGEWEVDSDGNFDEIPYPGVYWEEVDGPQGYESDEHEEASIKDEDRPAQTEPSGVPLLKVRRIISKSDKAPTAPQASMLSGIFRSDTSSQGSGNADEAREASSESGQREEGGEASSNSDAAGGPNSTLGRAQSGEGSGQRIGSFAASGGDTRVGQAAGAAPNSGSAGGPNGAQNNRELGQRVPAFMPKKTTPYSVEYVCKLGLGPSNTEVWAKSASLSPGSFITRKLAEEMNFEIHHQEIIERANDRFYRRYGRDYVTIDVKSEDNGIQIRNQHFQIREEALTVDFPHILALPTEIHVGLGADLHAIFFAEPGYDMRELGAVFMNFVEMPHGCAIQIYKNV